MKIKSFLYSIMSFVICNVTWSSMLLIATFVLLPLSIGAWSLKRLVLIILWSFDHMSLLVERFER